MIISACTCFEKFGELGIRTAGAYATHQIKIRCLKLRFETNDSTLHPRRLNRVHAALRLYLATHPRAPFECPGIALEEMLA